MRRPQIMPAVSSTTFVTVQLASSGDDLLPPQTRRALLGALNQRSADLDTLYSYAHDNQLGDAAERWKGRRPADDNLDDFLTMLVVNDQIGPAMNREVGDQFAKDPEWDATRTGEKLDEQDEIVTALSDWHREAGLTEAAKAAARSRFWSGTMLGRVYIPEEYQPQLLPGAPGRPTTLAQALDLIHVQAVDPREGGPVEDGHGRVLGYWYAYTPEERSGGRTVEVHTPQQVLTFRERDGRLELEGAAADSPFHNPERPQRPRRAEYLMWHTRREGGSAITRTARDSQDRLNVVVTYHGRNDDQTGYRQLIVTNAEQPRNARGQPVAFPMGPGVALNIRGLKKPAAGLIGGGDRDAAERHTPTVDVVEPLNPAEYHIPSEEAWKRRTMAVFDQAWILDTALNTSAVSKRESRKPYDRRVAFASQDTGSFLAWALRAALMLAGQVLGRVNEFRDVTFQPKLYLDVDAVNLEELRVKLQMWESGALTLVSLLEATPGVPDAAKEASMLEEERPEPAGGLGARRAALERLAGGQPLPGGEQGSGAP